MGGLAVLALLGLYIFLAITVFNAAKTTSAKVIALLLILLIPTADAIYGRIKLQQMCKAEGGFKVYRVVQGVEGFMYEFADERWITQYGYQFVEVDEYPGSDHQHIYPKYTRLFLKEYGEVGSERDDSYKSKYRFKTQIGRAHV